MKILIPYKFFLSLFILFHLSLFAKSQITPDSSFYLIQKDSIQVCLKKNISKSKEWLNILKADSVLTKYFEEINKSNNFIIRIHEIEKINNRLLSFEFKIIIIPSLIEKNYFQLLLKNGYRKYKIVLDSKLSANSEIKLIELESIEI